MECVDCEKILDERYFRPCNIGGDCMVCDDCVYVCHYCDCEFCVHCGYTADGRGKYNEDEEDAEGGEQHPTACCYCDLHNRG